MSQHKRYKKYQQHTSQTDRLDIKHIPKVPLPMRMIIKSQDDIIRGEHDRGEEAKMETITFISFFSIKKVGYNTVILRSLFFVPPPFFLFPLLS